MLNRITLALAIALVSCSALRGQDPKAGPTFDGVRAKQYVNHLSSDAMQGRESCTDGYREAADWVASSFKTWRLKPAGEDGTFFQDVEIRPFDWKTGLPTLKIGSRDFLLDDGDFLVHSESTADTTLQGEVIFVGYGISAPDKGLDEYANVDVKGRIVLALTGSPKEAPAAKGMFVDPEDMGGKKETEEWKEESTDSRKISTAYDNGAAAILLYDPDSDDTKRLRSTGSTPDALKPDRKFLAFAIRERVFRAIMKQDPQESPDGLKRRIGGLRRQIKAKTPQSFATNVQAVLRGYEEVVRHDEENGNIVARNVLAKIEGNDPKLKSEYVFVGAHLDHVGVRNGYVYNGADDNASGSAVVMELARTLSEAGFRPKRTLVFCCWTGEERGLIGSLHYTSKPCDGVTMDQVVAYFNLDMVGMGKELRAMGGLNFPSIWDLIIRDQDEELMKRIKPSESGPGGSDHTGFIKRGIEAMMLISGGGIGHQDYHKPEDDSAKIDAEMLGLAGRFVLKGMMNLANEPKVKLLIPRRQDIYRGMRMNVTNFNPAIEGSRWTQVKIEQKTKETLQDELYDRTRDLLNGKEDSGKRAKKSITRGSTNLKIVGDDTKLLNLAVDFHGIGRVDLEGDDGIWIADGRLTDAGKASLKALQENGVTIRLISPGERLIRDMLSAASRPFIITGDYTITDRLVDPLNRRGVQLGIDLNPKKAAEFVARVEELKHRLGDRRNLFAYLTSKDGLDKSKRSLYVQLIDRGWVLNEISGSQDHAGLMGGASLAKLGSQ
jgi:peptidase M28-like protein